MYARLVASLFFFNTTQLFLRLFNCLTHRNEAKFHLLSLQYLKQKIYDPFLFHCRTIFSYILNLVVLVILGGLTARYLGPEKLGLLSYASAVITVLVPFMDLGINKSLPVLLASNKSISAY